MALNSANTRISIEPSSTNGPATIVVADPITASATIASAGYWDGVQSNAGIEKIRLAVAAACRNGSAKAANGSTVAHGGGYLVAMGNTAIVHRKMGVDADVDDPNFTFTA